MNFLYPDAVSNRLVSVDGRGYATTYSYDALDSSVLTTTSYDQVGQVKQVNTTVASGGVAYSLSYAYDVVGNRTVMSDGEGHATTYSYVPIKGAANSADLHITAPYETNYSRITFDRQGRVDHKYLVNGVATNLLQHYAPSGETIYRYYRKGGASQYFYYEDLDVVGNVLDAMEE